MTVGHDAPARSLDQMRGWAEAVHRNVARVIIGKDEVVELLLIAMLSGGHVLIEDVPGTGKTMLARALAITLGLQFKRVQCTPDLLPNDITGVSVYHQPTGEFQFRPGPVFTNILLADEINRATPRTQSALLEAMQEQTTTVDGVTHALPQPFVVLATQNPLEFEGTFPLPEAQLDRFLMQISVGYPSLADEATVLRSIGSQHPIEHLEPLPQREHVMQLRQIVDNVHVADQVLDYVLRLVQGTRQHLELALGASPRASLALYRAAQAAAALQGRQFVIPDDVKRLVRPVLQHRLVVRSESALRGRTAQYILNDLLLSTPVDEATQDAV